MRARAIAEADLVPLLSGSGLTASAHLHGLGLPPTDIVGTGGSSHHGGLLRGKLSWHIDTISVDNFSAILTELTIGLLRAVTGFAAFLDADWKRWGWKYAGRFSTAPRSFEL